MQIRCKLNARFGWVASRETYIFMYLASICIIIYNNTLMQNVIYFDTHKEQNNVYFISYFDHDIEVFGVRYK